MNQIRNILSKIPWAEIGAYLGARLICKSKTLISEAIE